MLSFFLVAELAISPSMLGASFFWQFETGDGIMAGEDSTGGVLALFFTVLLSLFFLEIPRIDVQQLCRFVTCTLHLRIQFALAFTFYLKS
jgi:hypothetical protein